MTSLERAITYWRVLVSRRTLILGQTLAIALLAVAVVLLVPSWYTARTEILPPAEEEGGLSLNALLSGVKVPGISIPGSATPVQQAIAVLKSRWVAERLVREFGLQARYKTKFMDDAIATLHTHTVIATTDQGTITVAVEDRDRRRSADLANAYAGALDEFNRTQRTSRGRAVREFVERRLRETADSLALAENALVAYQRTHADAALPGATESILSSAARLMAERMSAAVRVQALESSVSSDNPQLIEARNALQALDAQLARIPESSVEAVRLARRVKVEESLFSLLTAQYEDARITEARDTPTIDVLDHASPPDRRSRPKRALTVATAGLLGLAWSVFTAFALEALAGRRAAAARPAP